MALNTEYIDLKYALVNFFLVEADKNVLDVSYNVDGVNLTIQVVLLAGYTLSQERMATLTESLAAFNVTIREVYLTKEQFNENKGEWRPTHYEWLKYLLFSKDTTT